MRFTLFTLACLTAVNAVNLESLVLEGGNFDPSKL